MTNETPSSLGYRMPAEWEPHSATWITWPHNPETWPDHDIQQVEKEFLAIVHSLASSEPTHILVNDKDMEVSVEATLKNQSVNMENIFLHDIPTNDSWIRDYGPNFLVQKGSGKVAANDWDFDSWGGKYKWELDDLAGTVIAEESDLHHFKPEIVLEGGAIDVNGVGTCMTTESCILNPNRNNKITRVEMKKLLQEYLGVSKIIWLDGDIEGDDTDGHIDNLARFVNPKTIVCAVEEDEGDANYPSLKKNYDRLKSATDQNDQPLKVIPLPTPGYVGSREERLPASYANFYIANKSVLVPVYGQANDRQALEILASLFPQRKIIPIPCSTLIWGLGGVHCLTQQQPASQ
ncbi:MAG: agmatine deiminase family protein [Nitrospina sp.]|jgi:agmatine deiminase|nr:agmatine deiminase family protein [Nitrospina sp.]MBT6717826.1 agmatine deiminase family protein [Nitrospina sp.]